MNQTSENGKKKLISGPSLAQMLAHKIYFKGFTSTGSKKCFHAIILRNFQET